MKYLQICSDTIRLFLVSQASIEESNEVRSLSADHIFELLRLELNLILQVYGATKQIVVDTGI